MAVSTNSNIQYYRRNFMETVTINGVTYLNVLSSTLELLINSITQYTSIPYDGHSHITTISYQNYGTTTLWWLILKYNGYQNWWLIPNGAMLKIPSLPQIQNFLNQRVTVSNNSNSTSTLI